MFGVALENTAMTIVCVKGMSANFEGGQRQEKPAADWGCNTSSPATGLVGMRVLEVPVVEKEATRKVLVGEL